MCYLLFGIKQYPGTHVGLFLVEQVRVGTLILGCLHIDVQLYVSCCLNRYVTAALSVQQNLKHRSQNYNWQNDMRSWSMETKYISLFCIDLHYNVPTLLDSSELKN